jgi:hypothetical protein
VKQNWAEQLDSILAAKKFNKFFDGVEFKNSYDEIINLRCETVSRRLNVIGSRFSKFSFVAKTVASNGLVGFGYGEAENKLLSIQKSIAESIERVVYFSFKQKYGLISSNGWAAHLTKIKSEKSAAAELLERDAILSHWLTETPLNEISQASFPLWLESWILREISKCKTRTQIRLFITTRGFIPVVQCHISDAEERTYISQGSSLNLDAAIYKAVSETCRIKSVAEQNRPSHNPISGAGKASAWDHAMAYAGNSKLPEWIFGEHTSYSKTKGVFKRSHDSLDMNGFDFKFKTYECGDLFVTQCTSEKVQNLFFGGAEYAQLNGLLNIARLTEVKSGFTLNTLPHCVP